MGDFSTSTSARIQRIARPVLLAKSAGDPSMQQHVDDLCQSLVLKLGPVIERGDSIGDVDAYIRQSARYAYLDECERLKRQQRRDREAGLAAVGVDDEFDVVDSMQQTPGSDVVMRDDRRRHRAIIQEALAEAGPLNDTERAVLLLRFGDGRSSAEVAERLGMGSAHSVDSIASRARRKLLAHLERQSPTLHGMLIDKLRAGPFR